MKRTIVSRVARLEDRVIAARRTRFQIRVVSDPEKAEEEARRARSKRLRSARHDFEDAGCIVIYVTEEDIAL